MTETDSESDDEARDTPLEKLKAKQAKERKELQAKITALKHGIKKNDKKKKKEVNEEIEKLEKEQKERHGEELRKLEEDVNGFAINHETKSTNAEEARENKEPTKNEQSEKSDHPIQFFKEIKLSKAQQKKEDQRKKQAKVRAAAVAQDEENAQTSKGVKESEALLNALEQRGLRLVEVLPDGDCLYSALAYQCEIIGPAKHSAMDLRQMAANHIKQNSEEFIPFLVNADGNPLEEGQFDEYCDKIKRMCAQGGNWGGGAELRALSTILAHPIEVLHANGKSTIFGEQFGNQKLPMLITYHQHAFTLGEHYNSTEPAES